MYGMFIYSSGSIFGPLIFFGIIGYLVDVFFNTKPLFLIISVIIAFITSNLLIMNKVRTLLKKIDNKSVKSEKK